MTNFWPCSQSASILRTHCLFIVFFTNHYHLIIGESFYVVAQFLCTLRGQHCLPGIYQTCQQCCSEIIWLKAKFKFSVFSNLKLQPGGFPWLTDWSRPPRLRLLQGSVQHKTFLWKFWHLQHWEGQRITEVFDVYLWVLKSSVCIFLQTSGWASRSVN